MKNTGEKNIISRVFHFIIEWWKEQSRTRKLMRRAEIVFSKCGCVAFCPHCDDILNDQADWSDPNNDGHGEYKCNTCNKTSEWHFGIAPGPICLSKRMKNNQIKPSLDVCSVCGKEPDYDMSGCGFCDKLVCDNCGVSAHDNKFCSTKCADEYSYSF